MLGASSARSGRARPARKSPGAEKVEKIEFLEVFEATPDLYGLELPDSKNGKDFRVSATFLVRTAFFKSPDPGFPMDPSSNIHHVYTMNLDRLSLLRPLASDGRTRKNALSASARSVPLRSARSVPESIRCIIKLECGRWGTAQHGMLASCAERGRSSTKCPTSRWDPTFCATFSRLCRKRAKMGHSGPPFGAPFGGFCANSCVFEIPCYHIFPLKKS